MINADSYLTLMISPIHITINHKIHTAGLVHLYHTDVMSGIILSAIHSLITSEAENLRKLLFRRLI